MNWNTQNLKPGAYTLKLDLVDNWGNLMTATKPFTLMPLIVGEGEFVTSDEGVKVYPNPFNNQIHFVVPDGIGELIELIIFDGMGREVVSLSEVALLPNGRIQIDGSTFPSGVYHYRLKMENGNYSGKLVKF